MREAGLVISSDLCPVTPGSCTRLSTSSQIITCNRLGQSLISLLEPDYPSLALAVPSMRDGRGAFTTEIKEIKVSAGKSRLWQRRRIEPHVLQWPRTNLV
jgi:hypothetical protein